MDSERVFDVDGRDIEVGCDQRSGSWERCNGESLELLASVAGVRNAADGRLVVSVVGVLVNESWAGSGVHSPVQWLMWQAGLARSTARRVLLIARRAGELPRTVGLLCEGRLSLDQAYMVARYTPAEYEESVCNLALHATVSQIGAATRSYGFDIEAKDPKARNKRGVAFGSGDDGTWWARVCLGAEEGAVVEKALGKVRDTLHDDARCKAKELARLEGRPVNGTDTELGVEDVDWGDALVGMANSALANTSGSSQAPRTALHLHLEQPAEGCGDDWIGELHGGTRVPSWLRRQLGCDADINVVWCRNGIPFSSTRAMRTPPERLRRVVERRDRYRCRVPGCDQTRWLQIHHIIHWEDSGETVTENLVCLCGVHHRQHHQGLLGITGNPNISEHQPGGLVFTNEHGSQIPPSGSFTSPSPDDMPKVAPYQHPTGEPLQKQWVHFNKTTASAGSSDPPDSRTSASGPPQARSA